jgi:hypothetical protein
MLLMSILIVNEVFFILINQISPTTSSTYQLTKFLISL